LEDGVSETLPVLHALFSYAAEHNSHRLAQLARFAVVPSEFTTRRKLLEVRRQLSEARAAAKQHSQRISVSEPTSGDREKKGESGRQTPTADVATSSESIKESDSNTATADAGPNYITSLNPYAASLHGPPTPLPPTTGLSPLRVGPLTSLFSQSPTTPRAGTPSALPQATFALPMSALSAPFAVIQLLWLTVPVNPATATEPTATGRKTSHGSTNSPATG
jgi:hypothetical protein